MNEPERAPNEFTQTVIGELLPERVGSVIGPYKLLQQIGEGGFGVVYMAEQEKPVRRGASRSRSSSRAWTRPRSSPASSRSGRPWP